MVKWYTDRNLAWLAGVPLERDLWFRHDHKISPSQECDMGPKRGKGLMLQFWLIRRIKRRKGALSTLWARKPTPGAQETLLLNTACPSNSRQWWKVWKLSDLRNIITLFKTATKPLQHTYHPLLGSTFFFHNMQHSLLLHEFTVYLSPWQWRHFSVFFI